MKDFVREIYEKNKEMYDCFLYIEDDTGKPEKSYVYEWFTVANNKVFYVGKGVGSRKNHVLLEIKRYEENPRKYKGQRWKELQDAYGIDCRIVMDGLTNEEAEIMEIHFIVERIKQREPLLQFVIPWEFEEVLNKDDYNFWESVNYPPKGTSFIKNFEKTAL